MGFLSNLFGKKEAPQNRNPTYEQHLKCEFGVDYGKGGWGVEGAKIIDDMSAQLSDPDICLGVLKGIRDKVQFNQICIVASPKMVVLICNSKPKPTCFITGLNASKLGGFVGAAIKEGAKCDVHENSPWVITL